MKTFFLAFSLLCFDTLALRTFANQPEAIIFAVLATLTLPLFLRAAKSV
jgi:hypothetical protein